MFCDGVFVNPTEPLMKKGKGNDSKDAKSVVSISDENDEDRTDSGIEDSESDVSALRKMVKIERGKTTEALSELAKERAASTTAAEEAMALILRLQNEKRVIEMESNHYRKLAEEKQIHDQKVIQSLQWLVRKHQLELEEQHTVSRGRFWMDENGDGEEVERCFNGSILDALEYEFYSSREGMVDSSVCCLGKFVDSI